jgi:hypothetical protein
MPEISNIHGGKQKSGDGQSQDPEVDDVLAG